MKSLAILAVLALAVPAEAQCRRGFYGTSSYYVAPSYYTPYKAPTYYTPPYYYPKIVSLAVAPDYYFSVNSYYRDNLLADAIAFRLLSRQGGAAGAAAGVPNLVPQAPPQPVMPRVQPGAFRTDVNPKLIEVVNASCIKCHGATPSGGASVSLVDLSTVPPGLRWHAHGLVNTGEMPKGGKELGNDVVLLFYEWAKQGSAAIATANRRKQ